MPTVSEAIFTVGLLTGSPDGNSKWCSTGISARAHFVFDLHYDIDDGLSSKISKFADDTKIASTVTTASDKEKLQNNLDRLASWAQKW